MSEKVINFPGITRLDIPPHRVLEEAKNICDDTAVVIGWTSSGDFYFASSVADGGGVLWLLELAKKSLLDAATSK